MKHIRLLLATFAVVVGLGGLVPSVALAETPKQTVCQTLVQNNGCDPNSSKGASVNSVVTAAVNILSFVVGVAAVIMVMVGGFRYITSGGDSNNVSSAKNTILYAVIGLVIAVLAQAIVQFVLKKL